MDLLKVVEGLPKTELVYWRDSYVKSFEAEVLRVVPDGKKKAYLILGKTIFHYKGGGQPSDSGNLMTTSGTSFSVKKVMAANEVVVHYGFIDEGGLDQLNTGTRVKGEINWSDRYSAMRKHTAGHLLDHCLDTATGRSPRTIDSWLGDPSYVTYAGQMPSPVEIDKAIGLEIESIKRGLPVRIDFVSYEEMLRVAADAPNIARLPQSDLMRIVTIEGCKPIPCGGTHVSNTREIGRFELRKFEVVDDGRSFRVYYNLI
ncbi:MAG: alanyl-tRNA editing protein [Promethearchaeati archaeon SRVP18_Atabeyarchaeia-1]